jgi:multiple sugar transport system substrate-binding protein
VHISRHRPTSEGRSLVRTVIAPLIGLSLVAGALAAPVAAQDQVTVKFNILGYSPNTPVLYQKAIDDFQAENPNIRVELSNGSWDTAYEKILSWINTGDSPDITVLGPKWLPELISLDGLQPFDEYLSEGFLDDFSPSLTDPLKFDGQQYSIPEALSTRMMYYRTDALEAAGITEPPSTWDDYVPALQAAQNPEELWGMAIQGAGDESVWYYSYFMLGAGGYFTDAEGNWKLNSPENVEGLQFMVDLVSKHGVSPPDPTAVDQDTVQALFTGGSAIAYWGPPWTLPAIDPAIAPSVAIAPYPTKSGEPAPLFIQDSFVLFKSAKHPAEAVKFLEFWSQPKYQVEFNVVESLIPVTISAGNDPAFTENPALQEFVKAIPVARSYPLKVGWESVNVALRTAVQAALLGEKTPQQALDDAQAEVEAKAQ